MLELFSFPLQDLLRFQAADMLYTLLATGSSRTAELFAFLKTPEQTLHFMQGLAICHMYYYHARGTVVPIYSFALIQSILNTAYYLWLREKEPT